MTEPKKRFTEKVILAIIGLVVVVFQGFISLNIGRVNNKVEKVENKVDTVHQQINSRMDQLLEVTEKASKAEGKAEQDSLQKSK